MKTVVRPEADPLLFLNTVENTARRTDCFHLLEIMKSVAGAPPQMWGDKIIGFGSYHYKYASGREGDWFLIGFSPRKDSISIYLMGGFAEFEAQLSQLGKYKTGVSCLYVKQLADVDIKVLQELFELSVKQLSSP